MPQLSAYLSFDGNCAEAMRFYERVLGGRLEALVRYADAPPDAAMPALSAEDSGRIMHARLGLDEQTLMGSDATAGHPYPGKQGVALSLAYPTVSDAQRVFDMLADGGSITHAAAENLLGRSLWRADRPIRHPLDGQRRTPVAVIPAPTLQGTLIR